MPRDGLRVLFVRPKSSGLPGDGDNVVHDKAIARLAEIAEVRVVEFEMAGGLRRLANLARSGPPEVARHMHPSNRSILLSAAQEFRPHVICLSHENTFPSAGVAKSTGAGVVLYAHNVHSQIVDTDRDLPSLAFAPAVHRFERRIYGDPAVELVAMSASDARYLRQRGVRESTVIAAPGAPPATPLNPGARAEAALVITGNYSWWRKRRDLRRFARQPGGDGVALYVNAAAAGAAPFEPAKPAEDLDWGAAVRFGVITDRFGGGFKLKSTEYIARNCALISLVDLFEEFEGLPHAAEFVRTVESRAEAEAVARQGARVGEAFVARFLEFKAACLARYAWSVTMAPLAASITRAADRTRTGAVAGTAP